MFNDKVYEIRDKIKNLDDSEVNTFFDLVKDLVAINRLKEKIKKLESQLYTGQRVIFMEEAMMLADEEDEVLQLASEFIKGRRDAKILSSLKEYQSRNLDFPQNVEDKEGVTKFAKDNNLKIYEVVKTVSKKNKHYIVFADNFEHARDIVDAEFIYDKEPFFEKDILIKEEPAIYEVKEEEKYETGKSKNIGEKGQDKESKY